MRVVLDTNVVIAAFRYKRGASRLWLRAALTGGYTLLATPPVFLEYEAVLKRSEHLAAAGATLAQVDAILDALAAVLEPVEVSFLWRPQLRDPADEMVLEAAVNGRADWLVTFNLRHLAAAAARFGIHAGRPADILQQCPEIEQCARATLP